MIRWAVLELFLFSISEITAWNDDGGGGKQRQEQQHEQGVDGGSAVLLFRFLQRSDSSESEGGRTRTVLTFLYLSVLGMCFLTPVLYYVRLHCEERAVRRRLQAMEVRGLETVLSRSERGFFGGVLGGGGSTNNDNNSQNAEESRAARRKYIAERRARILQLFAPVRVVSERHDIICVLSLSFLPSHCGP